MYQLKRQGDDRQKLEQEIFTAGCKLRTIMEENQKLEDVCRLSDVKKGEITLYYSAVQELVLGGGGNSNKQNYNLLLHSMIHAWLDWFGIIKGCQKLAEEILDLRKQMEEDAGLKQKLDEELEAVKGKFVFSHSNKYTFVQQTNVCLLVCLFKIHVLKTLCFFSHYLDCENCWPFKYCLTSGYIFFFKNFWLEWTWT